MAEDNKKRIPISNIIMAIIFLALAFSINQWSINKYSENIDSVNFCKEHYDNQSFMDLFYDYEPYVLKSCSDRDKENAFKIRSYNYKEDYCPEITQEQLRFSGNCGWMNKDYLLFVLKIGGGFFLPLLFLFGHFMSLKDWIFKEDEE